MLSNLYSEHCQRASVRKQVQDTRRIEASDAAARLTGALVDHLNVGVAQAYLNQKRLDVEAKQLHSHANNFARQTQQWLNLVDQFNSSLKELGDVESWSRAIERDMKTISSALEYTYKVNKEANVQALAATAVAPAASSSGSTSSNP
jgi:hypothetical protein